MQMPQGQHEKVPDTIQGQMWPLKDFPVKNSESVVPEIIAKKVAGKSISRILGSVGRSKIIINTQSTYYRTICLSEIIMDKILIFAHGRCLERISAAGEVCESQEPRERLIEVTEMQCGKL